MKWIPVEGEIRDIFPKQGSFLTLWKGAFCLTEYDGDNGEDCFHISYLPAQYKSFKVSECRESKFSHYMLLEYPEDY